MKDLNKEEQPLNNQENEKSKKRKKKKYLLLLLLLLLLSTCTAVNYKMNHDNCDCYDNIEDDLTVNETGDDEIKEAVEKEVSTFRYIVNPYMYLAEGKMQAMGFENKNENRYIRLQVYLRSNDKLVYDSKLVAPGKLINNDANKFSIDKGDYKVYYIISSYDLEQNYVAKTKFDGAFLYVK